MVPVEKRLSGLRAGVATRGMTAAINPSPLPKQERKGLRERGLGTGKGI